MNTQEYLIENTFISFGFSLFYPFLINIFPVILRNCAIHSSNKEQKCLYSLSQIIQLININDNIKIKYNSIILIIII